MKKGYILALSLKILIMVSAVYLIKYNQVTTVYNLYNESDMLYERLKAEKYILDEILFRLYIYDFDDFDDGYDDYLFEVKMSESNVVIEVAGDEVYYIDLVYEDECLCFTEIMYK